MASHKFKVALAAPAAELVPSDATGARFSGKVSMLRAFTFAVFCAFVPLAFGQEKPKGRKTLSPSDVVKRWNDAAAKRDMKTMVRLASKTRSRRSLQLIQQQGFLEYRGETKIIHQEIRGQRAVVVYRLENRDAVFTAAIRYGMNLLVREDGVWKVEREEGFVILKKGKQHD